MIILKRFTAYAAAFILLAGTLPAAFGAGNVPYDTYNYDYREDVIMTPAAYVPGAGISGVSLGVGAFNKARDITVAPDGLLYVADTGNNRVVIVAADLRRAVAVIDAFERDGETDGFRSPSGVAVSEKNEIYVADSDNHRVVVLDGGTFELVKIVENPVSEVLPQGFVFTPLRLTVDYADRIYVVAQNMFQGIMVFEPEGNFTGFFGTIEVQISLWQRFWRAIATKAERAGQRLFVPTEFTGVDVDPEGFVYASNVDPQGVKAVRRLNPKGQDVALQGENANTGGDIDIEGGGEYGGASHIVDVTYRGKGIYSLLDSLRGRIFTYDREGNLLYIFGGLGTQAGTFRTPSAIESVGSKILVLDYIRNEILTFEETAYGRLINEAVGLRFDGDETLAVDKWHEVLKLNENLELANVGIGKAYLTAGDNELAMKYLRLGMNRTYYSIAFKRYRNDILKENLGWALTLLVVLVIAFPVFRYIRRRGRGERSGNALTGDV